MGRPVPSIEVQIRGEDGTVLGAGETGELFVRGEQVSGRYTGIGSVLDADGWFPPPRTWPPSMRTATSTSAGAPMTRSSAAGRTSPPRRDRGCPRRTPTCAGLCRRRRRGPRVGGQIIVAVVVPAAETSPRPPRTCDRSSVVSCVGPGPPRPRGLPRRTTHQRDRQSAAPRARQRAERIKGARMIKNGTRLQSQVCDTQVIVVRSSDSR